MARVISEGPPGRHIVDRRRAILLGFGLAAGGTLTLAGLSLRPDSQDGASPNPQGDGGFPRPSDQGYATLTEEQMAFMQRNYPEIAGVTPQRKSGYDTADAQHRYFFYTHNLRSRTLFDFDRSAQAIDKELTAIVGRLQEDRSSGLAVVRRPDVNSIVAIEPTHFPLPEGFTPEKPVGDTLWLTNINPVSDEFLGVINTADARGSDPDVQYNELNIAFNAVSAAKIMQIEGVSPQMEKDILEVVGNMPFARKLKVSYDVFIRGIGSSSGWAPDRKLYESVRNDLTPIFDR